MHAAPFDFPDLFRNLPYQPAKQGKSARLINRRGTLLADTNIDNCNMYQFIGAGTAGITLEGPAT